jgi:hypothetical protein
MSNNETNYKEALFAIIFDVLTTFCTKEVTSFRVANEFSEEDSSIFLQNADTYLPITLSHIPQTAMSVL